MATPFVITVNDTAVKGLIKQLQTRATNLAPVMQQIGEDMVARTRARFATSTDPAGNKWLPNAQATYTLLAGRFSKRMLNKDGRVNKQGANKLAAKKPLIGETGDLRRQFKVNAFKSGVEVSNSMVYAAIQQFGGLAGRGKKVKIPARPFLPVFINGDLYPDESAHVVKFLNDYLTSNLT